MFLCGILAIVLLATSFKTLELQGWTIYTFEPVAGRTQKTGPIHCRAIIIKNIGYPWTPNLASFLR